MTAESSPAGRSEFRGIRYRATDGRSDFGFTFAWIAAASTWRIYIDAQPSYGTRSSALWDTHRLTEGPRYYICWTHRLATLHTAQQVAAMWAEATTEYLRSGRFGAPSSAPVFGRATGIAAFDDSRNPGEPS